MRGASRDSKAGNGASSDPDLEEWARKELEASRALIDGALKYIEAELTRLQGEEGNAQEVVALVKFLWQRADRASRLREHGVAGDKARSAAAEDRRRYDLQSALDSDQEG